MSFLFVKFTATIFFVIFSFIFNGFIFRMLSFKLRLSNSVVTNKLFYFFNNSLEPLSLFVETLFTTSKKLRKRFSLPSFIFRYLPKNYFLSFSRRASIETGHFVLK